MPSGAWTPPPMIEELPPVQPPGGHGAALRLGRRSPMAAQVSRDVSGWQSWSVHRRALSSPCRGQPRTFTTRPIATLQPHQPTLSGPKPLRRPSTVDRVWRADLPDVQNLVALHGRSAAERQGAGQRDVEEIEPRDLCEEALRTANHPAGGHIVLRSVPRAHEASVLVDPPLGQVCEEVPASPGHREELSLGVPHGVLARPNDLARGQLGCRADLDLVSHLLPPGRNGARRYAPPRDHASEHWEPSTARRVPARCPAGSQSFRHSLPPPAASSDRCTL